MFEIKGNSGRTQRAREIIWTYRTFGRQYKHENN
jgi:hypothetical protein